jgi:serine/threonine-protein kinase SRPK3
MNIYLRIEDKGLLPFFENAEMTKPSARKTIGPHTVYDSRGLLWTKNHGRPVLCDFGEARFGQESYTDDIQPYPYRAPEVILKIPWSYGVDIWNVGVMVSCVQVRTRKSHTDLLGQIWPLFENKLLFSTRDRDGNYSSGAHLASIVAILEPPPPELLQRSETSWEYFKTDGTLKDSFEVPDVSLETSATRLDGDNKVMFLDFIRKMLDWMPEKRHTAGQLLAHPWLRSE